MQTQLINDLKIDQNRLKKLYTEALNMSYNNKMVIKEFTMLPTYEFNSELSDWIHDSYSVFLSIEKPKDYMENNEWREVAVFLERAFTYECVVDFD